MARTTLPPPQADEAAQTPAAAAAAAAATPAQTAAPLRMPPVAMIVRIMTLTFLILSVSLLASNSTTVKAYNTSTTFHFNDIYAYRYALSTGVVGLGYTFLVLLSSIQQLRSGVLDPKTLFYEFLGDKVILALLATGVGAAFGATVDLKSNMDKFEDAFVEYLDVTIFAPIVSKFDDFFSRAYIPTIFLLIAFLTSGLSSLLSSLALTNKIT